MQHLVDWTLFFRYNFKATFGSRTRRLQTLGSNCTISADGGYWNSRELCIWFDEFWL